MEESIDILIVSYLKGEATCDQQKELLTWLELNEENRFYFRSIKDVYDLTVKSNDNGINFLTKSFLCILQIVGWR